MEKLFFKKVEVWVLLLLLFLAGLAALGFGIVVRQTLEGSDRYGIVGKGAIILTALPDLTIKMLAPPSADLESKEQRFVGRQGFAGKVADYQDGAGDNLLLLSRYDGDRERSVVELVRIATGEVLHTWLPDTDDIISRVPGGGEFKWLKRDHHAKRFRMLSPVLDADGGLTFHSTTPLIRVDACSKLDWLNTEDIFHHMVEADGEGHYWVASHSRPQLVDRFGSDYLDDTIARVSGEGELVFTKSVTGILLENDLRHEFYNYDKYIDDPIHLNDIQPVTEDGRFWKRGDVFLSLGHLNMVMLYRPATDELIWWTQQGLNHQHDVDIIGDGQISVFDNNSIMTPQGDRVDGFNEVLLFDLESGEVSSYLKESLARHEVRTISQGASRVLPNGNLYVEETNYGRLLEFSADGALLWEYINRAENGKVYIMNWSRIITEDESRDLTGFLESLSCE